MSRPGKDSLVDHSARGSYRVLLKDPSYLRIFLSQGVSSLGDWIGLIAIVAIAKRIYDNEFAVAAVLLARLAPTLLFGPVAGVIVDRWDRKRLMVICDILRAALISVLPFVEVIGDAVPLLNPVVLLLLVSAGLEMLTLLWQPAKDATIPDMVERHQIAHAYSLLLLAAYITFPLSGAAFGLLAQLSKGLGSAFNLPLLRFNQEQLALFIDALTFIASALITLTLRLKPRPIARHALALREVVRDLREGLASIWRHPLIRPWVLGITGTFAGVGVFISIAPFFVDRVLGAGPSSFGFLVTAVGTGLGVGFLLAGGASRWIPRDVLFTAVVIALGVSMIGFGSVSTLSTALVLAAITGLWAGIAYPSGYALMQENIETSLRGRVSAAVNSLIRLSVVGAAAVAPVVVRLVDSVSADQQLFISRQLIDIRGVRVVMWAGGLLILSAGLLTWNSVRARRRTQLALPGLFLVFEGGEGAGKTTQMERLREFLESRGRRVTVTREPGGTPLGARIREALLDPASEGMSAKTEALLYAADRAQHVDQVILPALVRGDIVISDRYVMSSIAYQGSARGLGQEEVRSLNAWATDKLEPDLVLLLDHEAAAGLQRSGATDRIEQEALEFHEKVREAYRMLASRDPAKVVIVDASLDPDAVAELVRSRVSVLLERETDLRGMPLPLTSP